MWCSLQKNSLRRWVEGGAGVEDQGHPQVLLNAYLSHGSFFFVLLADYIE